MFQQQLLVSVQPRPRDVLSVGVVEPQEGQDGLNQPQSRHEPKRGLSQTEICVESRGVDIQVKRDRLGLCTTVRTSVVIGDCVAPGAESQRQNDAGPSRQEEHTDTQQDREEGGKQGVVMPTVQIEEAPPALRSPV